MADLVDCTALELRGLIRRGETSACEVTRAFLSRAKALNGPLGTYEPNGALNAFIELCAKEAMGAAHAADAAGCSLPMSGLPVGIKDAIAIRGSQVSAGTPVFASVRAEDDATVWRRLAAQGAVRFGRTQAQAFITGLETPQTANPWDARRIAGGSSGGSAAAVVARAVPLALGTETSGSIIQPALCCGATGLKPTHGLVSLHGVWPGVPSLDVVGPLARTAADCALIMATISGSDPLDPRSRNAPTDLDWPLLPRPAERPLTGWRIGIAIDDPMRDESAGVILGGRPRDGCEPPFAAALTTATRQLESLGADVLETDLPRSPLSAPCAALGGVSAEAVIRGAEEIDHGTADPRDDGERIEVTREQYAVATAMRRAHAVAYEARMDSLRLDAVLFLQVGSEPPLRRGLFDTPCQRVMRHEFEAFNSMGVPVLSLPIERSAASGIPVSVQLAGRRFADPILLRIGIELQTRHPEVWRAAPELRGLPQPAVINTLR